MHCIYDCVPCNKIRTVPKIKKIKNESLCSATREAAIVRGPRAAMKSGDRKSVV